MTMAMEMTISDNDNKVMSHLEERRQGRQSSRCRCHSRLLPPRTESQENNKSRLQGMLVTVSWMFPDQVLLKHPVQLKSLLVEKEQWLSPKKSQKMGRRG